MAIIALGLNHQTAPVELREKMAFAPDAIGAALYSLKAQPGVNEALILSTCNRTELYCDVDNGLQTTPARWLLAYHAMTGHRLEEFLYRYEDAAAVRHLFRVATGLDSMVLGEPQILGQVKNAYQLARAAATLNTSLEHLFQQTFAVAKRVRTDTDIGIHPVSIAYTAVRLAEQVFADLKSACVLLIGAGDTIELASRHLVNAKVRRLIVANRTLANAQDLAGRFLGYAIALSDLPLHLAEVDIVIAASASREPLLTRSTVEAALLARRHRPMFLVDIAVPRNIEASVAELDDVFLYSIDDLHEVIDGNLRGRRQAAREAESIIDLEVEHYLAWRRARDHSSPLIALRHGAQASRDEVLAKARHLLDIGRSPDEALQFLAHTLTNKLLHAPSVNLRAAAQRGDDELLRSAERLFDSEIQTQTPKAEKDS